MKPLLPLLFIVLMIPAIVVSSPSSSNEKKKPVIGVFSLPSGFYLTHDMGMFSYIAVEYVELLKKTGARVVAIDYKLPLSEIKMLMDRINGLLIPGGGFTMWENKADGRKVPNWYASKAFEVVQYAQELNKKGSYFPVFGICLGFETIIFGTKNSFDLLSDFKHANTNDKIHSVDRSSKMFRTVSDKAVNWVQNNKVLRFNHDHGFEPAKFTADSLINRMFKITSKGYDKNGKEFVNSYEGRTLPFYGVQFHPEKNVFSFKSKNIDHSKLTIKFDEQLLKHFVSQCSKNGHSFNSDAQFQMFNIENKKLTKTRHTFMAVYFLLDRVEISTSKKLL